PARVGRAHLDASPAAQTPRRTAFQRRENLAFLPGSGFHTFFFDATGDTDATAGMVPALAARGAWGAIFRVDLNEQSNSGKQSKNSKQQSNKGKISIFALGDQFHASFDNLTF